MCLSIWGVGLEANVHERDNQAGMGGLEPMERGLNVLNCFCFCAQI